MYSVYRYFTDEFGDNTELLGIFPSEDLAQVYVTFYALTHLLSVDDFVIGFNNDPEALSFINQEF